MSVEIQAKIICDGCGETVVGPIQSQTSYAVESYSKAKCATIKLGWITLLRYGKARHYCPLCADKPQAKEGMRLDQKKP